MPDRPLTVSALTRRIHHQLADFGQLLVVGELSRCQVVGSGHCYATLKDADAVLSVVLWRSTVARLGRLPREGEAVEVRGSLSVYGPRGQYQLVATSLQAKGAGDLAARFEELKARLAAEGLFAAERKRPLPFLPHAVGIATANGSAALADILEGLGRRFPSMPVIHAPCQVQGAGSTASVVAALRRLDAHPEVAVIVVGRGGGGLEDLWTFNEEAVVRAIAACTTPIVSAVGHETDTTLADLVADERAKTPTAAAELVVPVEAELRSALADLGGRLDRAIDRQLETARSRLAGLARHRALAGPGHLLAQRTQQLDELALRLDQALDVHLAAARARLAQDVAGLDLVRPDAVLGRRRADLAGLARRLHQQLERRRQLEEERFHGLCLRLDAYSPLGVIARGYSVLRRSDDNAVVKRLEQAPPGTRLRARIADGWLAATVDGARAERLRDASGYYEAEG